MTTADSTDPSPTSAGTVTPARRGFGVDVGGSGIKGGIVDLDTGELVGDRYKLATPQPATPSAVAATIADVVNEFGWTGPLGVTYPGVVTHGIVRTAANVDKKWIGTNARDIISAGLNGQEVVVLNDADAAGLAEERYGAGKERDLAAQHRIRASGGRRQGSRTPRRVLGPRSARLELRKMGQAGDEGAGRHRERHVSRAVHRRRRNQPQGRQMGATAEEPDPGGSRRAAEFRGNRRGGDGGDARRDALICRSGEGKAALSLQWSTAAARPIAANIDPDNRRRHPT